MSPHLGAALAAVSAQLPIERIDQVWLFPPRTVGEKESGLAVLTVFEEGGDSEGSSADPPRRGDRRQVWTLQYEAERVKGGKTNRTDTLLEQATVPAAVLGRIVDGVVRRLGGDADAPDVREVDGSAARWAELLEDAGLPVVDPT
jgi:hypothetical protein